MPKAPDPLYSQKVWRKITLVKFKGNLRKIKGKLRKIKGKLRKIKGNLREQKGHRECSMTPCPRRITVNFEGWGGVRPRLAVRSKHLLRKDLSW